jgi:hypothetical protein
MATSRDRVILAHRLVQSVRIGCRRPGSQAAGPSDGEWQRHLWRCAVFEVIDGFADGVVAVRGTGRITADDYRSVLGPEIRRAATGGRKVRLYLEFGDGFEGYEGSAILADAGLGLDEFGTFARIAVVTDTDWLRHAMHLFGPLIPGDVREFPVADMQGARAWINAPRD